MDDSITVEKVKRVREKVVPDEVTSELLRHTKRSLTDICTRSEDEPCITV